MKGRGEKRRKRNSDGSLSGKMARWIKVLAAKPRELSLIPRIHIVEGEN